MGRSKRLNSKQAKEVIADRKGIIHGRSTDASFNVSDGSNPQRKLVRDTRRRASSENNWLHGVLFVAIALIIVNRVINRTTGTTRSSTS